LKITLEGEITDVEEFGLLSDVSRFTSYLISKVGGKVRCTVLTQGSIVLVVVEKAE